MLKFFRLTVVGLAGWLFSVSLHAEPPVRIAVSNTVLSLPVYVADAEGFFQQNAAAVELLPCVGGVRCMAMMHDGAADLCTATELPVVFSSFKRRDFAILTSFVSTSNDLKLVVRRDSGVKLASDLKGKRIAYIKGAASQYFTDLILLYHGINPQQVVLKEMNPDQTQDLLRSGQVDAVVVLEPYASKAAQDLADEVSIVKVPRLYTETFNLIGTKAILDGRPEAMERIVKSLQNASDFISANPERAKKILSVRLKISPDLVGRIFDDYRYKLSLNQSLMRTMDGQANWAVREGHVPRGTTIPNYIQFVNPAFLRKVDPQAVTLR
ncbi:ABC transporter substrate-binding protein [Limnobacter humi]|uniref:ABC transporter substrate-binding protein n=1 Tax=Limnobacter humi TaxID=1778671 RepID=A0ABT1WHG8_9BURK|nr:ABC transporter substrate-binding protein [Limnobacter humi]MCQ8896951.1 ABC transporter substrate-binding protein [Limnobacter humi]